MTSAQWTLPVRTSGSEAHHFTPVCQIKPIPLQFSALGEFLWYLIKDNQLDFILPYISAYADDSDDGLTVHGGYGPRIFDQRGHDQLENVIRQLAESPTSRRAVIQIFNAEDNAK